MKLKNAWGAITAAIGGLGALKSIVAIANGQELSLQQVAFYVGASAIVIYILVVGGLFYAGIAAAAASFLSGGKADDSETVMKVILGFGIVVGVVLALAVVFSDVLFDYQGTDGFGRGAVGLIGVAAVAAGIYLQRHYKAGAAAP